MLEIQRLSVETNRVAFELCVHAVVLLCITMIDHIHRSTCCTKKGGPLVCEFSPSCRLQLRAVSEFFGDLDPFGICFCLLVFIAGGGGGVIGARALPFVAHTVHAVPVV